MKSLLLGSILLVTFFAPVLAARDRHAMRGLRRMLLFLAVFYVAYVLHVAYVHTSLFLPQR